MLKWLMPTSPYEGISVCVKELKMWCERVREREGEKSPTYSSESEIKSDRHLTKKDVYLSSIKKEISP